MTPTEQQAELEVLHLTQDDYGRMTALVFALGAVLAAGGVAFLWLLWWLIR
jgi:hypothetical protein